MKKRIRKMGNQVGFTFSKEEQKIHDIKVEDIVDLSEMVIERRTKQ